MKTVGSMSPSYRGRTNICPIRPKSPRRKCNLNLNTLIVDNTFNTPWRDAMVGEMI